MRWSHLPEFNRGRARTPAELAELDRLHEKNRGRPLSPEHRATLSRAALGNANMMNAKVKGECVYCGDPNATTYDHVVPGEPERVVACVRCNASKRKRTPEQWFADGLIAA